MIEKELKTGKPYSMLVVDDDEDILNLIKLTMERWDEMNIDVSTTTDPKDAVQILESNDFDMILSDQRMKGMDGVELLSYVKDKNPRMIRIMITGYSQLELAKDAINKAKVDLYIEKPWTKDQIREDIRGLLESIESEDIEDVEIVDGSAYLFKEQKPRVLFEKGLNRINSIGEGMIITRIPPNKVTKMFDLKNTDIDLYWLSKISGQNTLNPVNLELIADMIIRYYENGGKTVILEGIDSLLRDNSFKRFEGFIDNIVDVAGMEEGAFLIGLDPRTIPDRELATLERKMRSLSYVD